MSRPIVLKQRSTANIDDQWMAHDKFFGGEDFLRYHEDKRKEKSEYNRQNPQTEMETVKKTNSIEHRRQIIQPYPVPILTRER